MKKLRLLKYRKILLPLVAVHIVTILFIFLNKKYLPPVVPLFYGRPQGAEQLAPTDALFILPILSMTLLVIGVFAAQGAKDKFIDGIILGAMVVFSILSIITLYKIISIVGSIPWLS